MFFAFRIITVILFYFSMFTPAFATDIADKLMEGGRKEISNITFYKSGYYKGGYPPNHEGVCTDLVSTAFNHAGYNLKELMDKDIKSNPKAYKNITKPDKNIDYRRVKNQLVFFQRHGESLTTVYDKSTADQWLPGDIVTFQSPDHVAIISDKKNRKSVPYLIHNDGPIASEGDSFDYWYKKGVTGHFRVNGSSFKTIK